MGRCQIKFKKMKSIVLISFVMMVVCQTTHQMMRRTLLKGTPQPGVAITDDIIKKDYEMADSQTKFDFKTPEARNEWRPLIYFRGLGENSNGEPRFASMYVDTKTYGKTIFFCYRRRENHGKYYTDFQTSDENKNQVCKDCGGPDNCDQTDKL